MDLTLEQRLLRFLNREEEGEARSSRDLRALGVEERVLEGECIQNAVFRGQSGDVFTFEVTENLSKFRRGDSLLVGDGADFDGACRLAYRGYDADTHELALERDRFARGADGPLEQGQAYCVDRRPLGLRGRLQEVVRAGFEEPTIAAVFAGAELPKRDPARHERATEELRRRGLNPVQVEAGADAVSTERLCLIQGPPGSGKTRLLAEMISMLCAAGCRIALTAFTHRAVDNVLRALRKLDPDLPLCKLGVAREGDAPLRKAGVRFLDPRHAGSLPARGILVAGTSFQLAKLPAKASFHYMMFDEAAQLPIPHALAGMLLSRRWVLLGDHRQLPPVVMSDHADREITASVFECLHDKYGSHLLNVTYRMNEQVCSVVGEAFYGGRLESAPEAASRRMPFTEGGALDEVLRPERSAVLARVDHLQPGMRSVEESNLVADLVAELTERHGLPASELAIVAPFRAQVRMIRSALQRRRIREADEITVDTVERIQGQEREVVIVSLAVGDPDTLKARASFFFSTNRLNVALSRARTKFVLVASRGAFEALPRDPESLRAASAFKRLFKALPTVDLTKVYA